MSEPPIGGGPIGTPSPPPTDSPTSAPIRGRKLSNTVTETPAEYFAGVSMLTLVRNRVFVWNIGRRMFERRSFLYAQVASFFMNET